MNKLMEKISKKRREKWLKNIKSRIKNNDFTIISNNCTAGFIYHDLGLQFKTPTINLFIRTDEYITFIKDLEYYLSCHLEEVKQSECAYPVGMLKSYDENKKDISIYFMHYKSFDEAKEKWDTRKNRVQFDNMCFILDFYDCFYDTNLIDEFNELNLKNKIVLIHNKDIQKKGCFYFKYKEEKIPKGRLFEINELSGKRHLDEFDYVSFINSIK